ncbi:hypothetical protein KC19_12G034000 [Ceratodon purpureus]|uniref:PGG domain-containing protein n=1 Tax=Ceratodon purpureus TaxID=3225 RepID=A0A8T0G3C6_CERPU|nr:hypothetical protein KC19_12G034000 [Ceratodon purpureus]
MEQTLSSPTSISRAKYRTGSRKSFKKILTFNEMKKEYVALMGKVDVDAQLLRELVQSVHDGPLDDAKRKLEKLLGSYQKEYKIPSVLIRAKVYSRLIAVALGLEPENIIKAEDQKSELSFDISIRLSEIMESWVYDDGSHEVLSYLLKVLEEDDDVMTVIFCDLEEFKMYEVPYFEGCNLKDVEQICNLWLSSEVLESFYFDRLIDPIVNKVKQVNKITDEDFIEAKLKICGLLQQRRVKAGARLFWLLTKYSSDNDNDMVDKLVTEIFNIKVIFDDDDDDETGGEDEGEDESDDEDEDEENQDGKVEDEDKGNDQANQDNKDEDEEEEEDEHVHLDFLDYFLEAWYCYWYPLDLLDYNNTDRVPDGHGDLICVGQAISSPIHPDCNLLCWAARRNYDDLIRCVMKTYKPVPRDVHPWKHYKVSYMWKFALWCAVRQGKCSETINELNNAEWTKTIDLNDYPGGWLPPLHLVALLGDWETADALGDCFDLKLCANKRDYLGRTPLDYAMQFQTDSSYQKLKYLFGELLTKLKNYRTPKNDIKETPKEVEGCEAKNNVIKETPEEVEDTEASLEKYDKPCHKDVVLKLLSVDTVRERLKELYDMYMDQANTVLIGAALIASVTFAGWLQPPLGYKDYFQFTRSGPSVPDGSTYYESYVAIEGHVGIEAFVVFNTLSFFLAIATMLVGAEATLFVHDNDERTNALMRMRKSIQWMISFFVSSMLCIMAAFTCAGITILPPIRRLEWSMIVSLAVGGGICIIPLGWILWSLNQNRVLSFIETFIHNTAKEPKLGSSRHLENSSLFDNSLIDSKQVKMIKSEIDNLKGEKKQNGAIEGGEKQCNEGMEEHANPQVDGGEKKQNGAIEGGEKQCTEGMKEHVNPQVDGKEHHCP